VAGTDQVVAPGATVTLDGTASKAFASKTITSYQWTQTGGTPTVTLATPTAATTTFTAPATGSLTFRLRVTDSTTKVGDDSVVVRVNNAPTVVDTADQTVPVGTVVAFTVTGSDLDGDALTYVAGSSSTVPLTALAPTGQFTWDTAGAAPGTYTLTYFATDSYSAQSTSQTMTITLTPGASAANPPSSGGGGGALPLLPMLLLVALLGAPAVRQRKQ
jgi:hypothetical protein